MISSTINSDKIEAVTVSVVIPVYNKESYVRDSIESVLSQNHKNIEIIAVNDGSTDGSASILKCYSDAIDSFTLINQENRGLSCARNVGIDNCKGEYVLFHDADDILKGDAIFELLKSALTHGSDVVGGVFEKGSGAIVNRFYANNEKVNFSKDKKLAIKHATNFSSCNKIFKVSFLNKNELRFTPGLYMQDVEFWLKVMFTSSNFTQVKAVVSVYRDIQGSSSKSRTGDRFSSLFKLFENLSKFQEIKNNKICSLVVDMAVMQGAIVFFARWKLEEYISGGNLQDVEKVGCLLNRIPEKSFFAYLDYANNGRAVFLVLVRYRKYSEAYQLSADFSQIRSPAHRVVTRDLRAMADNYALLLANPKILIFCGSLAFGKGGMEKVAAELANFLSEFGFSVSLGYFSRSKNKPSYFIRDDITQLPWNRRKESVLDYRNRIAGLNYDVAIAFIASCQAIQMLSLFYKTGTALVLHEGSNPERIVHDNWAVPRGIKYSDAAIEREAVLSAVTRVRMTLGEHKLTLPHAIANKTKAFPNAFPIPDLGTYKPICKSNKKRIINVGGMKPNKNVFPLIDAFCLLKDRFPDWEIVIFSAKYKGQEAIDYMDDVYNKIGEEGLENMVHIRDEVDDIGVEYYLSDIHVITSLSEGCPNCVAEAMTHGVPSIGFRSCPGVRSLIRNNEDGFLVEEGVDSLAESLNALMESEELRSKFGKIAKRNAQKYFDPNIVYQNWLGLACEALQSEEKWYSSLGAGDIKKYQPLVDKMVSNELGESSKKSLKIAIFGAGNLFNVGGLQRSYQVLTEYLVGSGHDVTLFSWAQPGKKGDISNKELAYPLNESVSVNLVPQKANLSNFQLIEAQLNELAPDVVVIVNSTQMSFFLAMICAVNYIPYIQSLRGSSDYCLKYLWPCKFLMDSVFYGAVKGHVLMPSYVDIFPDEIKRKIDVIPSQIEPSERLANVERPNSNERFVLLYSGRFSFEKRVDYLVHAFYMLSDQYADWDLWLYGTGPLLEKHRTLVHKLGLKNRVFFGDAKNTDEMYRVYPCAHIKVLPSEQEGCPMALREAMIHGIPVIAYRECSGSNEIIEHRKTGLLVDYIDNPVEELSKSIEFLMKNPSLRNEIGKNAFDKAKEYNSLIINSQWERLIVDAADRAYDQDYLYYLSSFREFAISCLEKKRFQHIFIFERESKLLEDNIKEYLSVYGKGLFDRKYYLETYLEVKKEGIDPLLHYITIGWLKGYNPSPYFNTNEYVKKYGVDVCPLYHYYVEGLPHGYELEAHDDGYLERNPEKRFFG